MPDSRTGLAKSRQALLYSAQDLPNIFNHLRHFLLDKGVQEVLQKQLQILGPYTTHIEMLLPNGLRKKSQLPL